MMTAQSDHNQTVIAIDGLVKDYHIWYRREKIQAVRKISFEVRKGEIFGFLGPNGAGKTTTIKLLLGLLRPNGGSIKILDGKPGDLEVKSRIGYMPERALLPLYLKLREMLNLFGSLSGIPAYELEESVDNALYAVELMDVAERSLDTFSKGMLQRAALAQALVHKPELLLLDEPAIGLDPIARRKLRELLLQLSSQGITIFLNSHELEVVQLICDRFAILDRGKILAIEPIERLRDRGKYIITVNDLPDNMDRFLEKMPVAISIEPQRKQFSFAAETIETVNTVVDEIRKENILITSLTPLTISLEEFFLTYINKEKERYG